MKKYAKIINEETKACEVGLGTNSKFYQSIGMVEMEVEEAYNGSWYVKGYAPVRPAPTNDEISQQRQSYYGSTSDKLTLEKLRKQAVGKWTEADEEAYQKAMTEVETYIQENLQYTDI